MVLYIDEIFIQCHRKKTKTFSGGEKKPVPMSGSLIISIPMFSLKSSALGKLLICKMSLGRCQQKRILRISESVNTPNMGGASQKSLHSTPCTQSQHGKGENVGPPIFFHVKEKKLVVGRMGIEILKRNQIEDVRENCQGKHSIKITKQQNSRSVASGVNSV